MMYLALSQVNTSNHLVLTAVDDDGWLYNPKKVEIQIEDLSTGSATQVYPAAPGEYADITTAGKVDTGYWYAYDLTTSKGWSPSGNEGLHRIKWKYTAGDKTTTLEWTQQFQVAGTGLGLPYATYISPNEVRAEGLTVAKCADDRLIELIERAQDYIERATRQPFRPIRLTKKADGNEANMLHFALPIIGVEYVKANSNTQAINQSSVAVYNSPTCQSSRWHGGSDNRRNPRIGLKSEVDIYSGSYLGSAELFAGGRQNQVVKGVFGYVEPDGNCPTQITYAMLKLVYATATKLTLTSSSSSSAKAGPIKKEKVDRHEIEYMESTSSTTTSALSSSPEVEEIIHLYRAPIGMGAAGPRLSSRVRAY